MTEPRGTVVGTALYFGCARGIDGRSDAGHYFYKSNGRGGLSGVGRRGGEHNPWGLYVDGRLAPMRGRYEEEPQGRAALPLWRLRSAGVPLTLRATTAEEAPGA